MNLLAAVFAIFLFSLTVPFTRLAALEMPALLVMSLRLCGAGLVCAVFIGIDRRMPPRRIWGLLAVTSFASVLGFSLLMALAFREVPATHGALGFALLPALTAAYAMLRQRQNPGWVFWSFAGLGTLLSAGYFAAQGLAGLYWGDLLLMLAVLVSMFGYVEGARMSREFGAVRVMSWAILPNLPVMLVLTWWLLRDVPLASFSAPAWLSVLYLGLVSQSSGMFLWFAVLARGPMERVAMVQLLQPLFMLVGAATLLGERVEPLAWVLTLLVVGCVVGVQRSRA